MDGIRSFVPALVLALVGIILQGLLANAITIGNATPNFIVAMALVIAAVFPTFGSVVLAFLMGLAYNLLCSGTLGTMALVLTLLSYLIVQIFSRMEQVNLIFALIVLFVLGFLAELFYGLLAVTFVSGISVSQALTLRALPCGVYDALISCVLYPLPALLGSFMANGKQDKGTWRT